MISCFAAKDKKKDKGKPDKKDKKGGGKKGKDGGKGKGSKGKPGKGAKPEKQERKQSRPSVGKPESKPEAKPAPSLDELPEPELSVPLEDLESKAASAKPSEISVKAEKEAVPDEPAPKTEKKSPPADKAKAPSASKTEAKREVSSSSSSSSIPDLISTTIIRSSSSVSVDRDGKKFYKIDLESTTCRCPYYEFDSSPRQSSTTQEEYAVRSTASNGEVKLNLKVESRERLPQREYAYNIEFNQPRRTQPYVLEQQQEQRIPSMCAINIGQARYDTALPYSQPSRPQLSATQIVCPPARYSPPLYSQTSVQSPATYLQTTCAQQQCGQNVVIQQRCSSERLIQPAVTMPAVYQAPTSNTNAQAPRRQASVGVIFSNSRQNQNFKYQCVCVSESQPSQKRSSARGAKSKGNGGLIEAGFECATCGKRNIYLVCKVCYKKNKIQYCLECKVECKATKKDRKRKESNRQRRNASRILVETTEAGSKGRKGTKQSVTLFTDTEEPYTQLKVVRSQKMEPPPVQPKMVLSQQMQYQLQQPQRTISQCMVAHVQQSQPSQVQMACPQLIQPQTSPLQPVGAQQAHALCLTQTRSQNLQPPQTQYTNTQNITATCPVFQQQMNATPSGQVPQSGAAIVNLCCRSLTKLSQNMTPGQMQCQTTGYLAPPSPPLYQSAPVPSPQAACPPGCPVAAPMTYQCQTAALCQPGTVYRAQSLLTCEPPPPYQRSPVASRQVIVQRTSTTRVNAQPEAQGIALGIEMQRGKTGRAKSEASSRWITKVTTQTISESSLEPRRKSKRDNGANGSKKNNRGKDKRGSSLCECGHDSKSCKRNRSPSRK
ncbi:uncharacterized protein LOC135384102 [Ornithodoros turicata]|uniref:uncharacterized protein LOC135384102 n=1 Tax=Ornithodoros turicata TaxID=34597 RepID=UPI0031395A71